MTETRPLRAPGERVWVADAMHTDEAAYVSANRMSRPRISEWNPVDIFGLPSLIRASSRHHHTLLIHTREPVGDHDLVGKVNITNVVRGRADCGTLGYDAFDPYAGQGLFTEGLALAVGLAFAPEPGGMGLHRLEVNVQPGNVRSAIALRRLGFRLEGHSQAYLRMPDASGQEAWRDHDRYALLESEWPPSSTAARTGPRVVAIVNGVPGSGKSTLAARLAAELAVPLLSKDIVKEAVADALPAEFLKQHGAGRSALGAGASEALWALLAHSPAGAVVESWFWPGDERYVVDGLQRAGIDPSGVPEVWCDLPVAVARERFEARAARGDRHHVHWTQVGVEDLWMRMADAARPLGLGPVLRVDTSAPLTDRDLVRHALQVRAAALAGLHPLG